MPRCIVPPELMPGVRESWDADRMLISDENCE